VIILINPDNRSLYLDALKPPAGYNFDIAVGSSYSLNLITLIMIPLALAKYSAEEQELEKVDKLMLLEALENNYEKIHIFCQRGEIKLPKNYNPLFAFLEDILIECSLDAKNRVFHPKVWILRFTNGNDYRYRFINLTRNISFDKSWDTIMLLEGSSEKGKIEDNKPLKDYILFLADKYVNNESRFKKLKKLAKEIMNVKFSAPEKFNDKIEFYPIGVNNQSVWPFKSKYNKALFISPFLSEEILSKVHADEKILISRENEIDKLYSQIKEQFNNIYILDDYLSNQQLFNENIEEDNFIDLNNNLHAKLYIFEDEEQTYLYSGSANATYAAFNGNLEFLTKITANKELFSIEQLLEKVDGQVAFRDLLKVYTPPSGDDESIDSEKLDKIIRDIKERLLNLDLKLKIEELEEENTYNLKLLSNNKESELKIHNKIKCWPITKNKRFNSVSFDELYENNEINFGSLNLYSMTSFIAFEIEIENKKHEFVLNLDFINPLAERKDKILNIIISDQDKFIRYLYLMLQEKNGLSSSLGKNLFKHLFDDYSSMNKNNDLPIMEDIMRQLVDDVSVIDRIDKFIKKIKAENENSPKIPESFYDFWNTIIEVRSIPVMNKNQYRQKNTPLV